MPFGKIPTFQEVKDWANNNLNYFDASDARSAVDNSNVSVNYADSAGDADTLDGNQANAFSQRTSPARNSNGGYVTHTGGGDLRSQTVNRFKDEYDDGATYNGQYDLNTSDFVVANFRFTGTTSSSSETTADITLTVSSSSGSSSREISPLEGESETSNWFSLYVAPDDSVSYTWTIDSGSSNLWIEAELNEIEWDRQKNWDEYIA